MHCNRIHHAMKPIIDPRRGDVEDDASSTKRRSLLAIAGTLLAEISLPKLAVAWILLIGLPGLLLGTAPLIGSAWLSQVSRTIADFSVGIWPLLAIAILAIGGWFGGRRLSRAVERGFWALNSMAVQPIYALVREGLRHISELMLGRNHAGRLIPLRAASAFGAGVVLCAAALWLAAIAWPYSRWIGDFSNLMTPAGIIVPALANTAIILNCYFAVAALVWGIADASMDQPRDIPAFDEAPASSRRWRLALLSDLHIVGERYGFRIESGRSGPRGNERLARVLDRLDAIHRESPLDHVLITGDITDAGRSAEWSEFFVALSHHPDLAARTLLLPGNHDINIVDRANPARFELPINPHMRLRQMRALSGIAAVQADRVLVVDRATSRASGTLAQALASRAADIAAFADTGTLRLSPKLAALWAECFPMILPPDTDDGLGIMLLNSTAETHFSFTNALGLVSSEQARAMMAVARQYPQARWIVALHHHLVEYPKRAKSFSERIGTSLINGSWLAREFQKLDRRAVVMHGHRHIDWVGQCGNLRIVSAPSPVMEVTDDQPSYFHIHTLAAAANGDLLLLPPERIDISGTDLLPNQT
jgi:Calcineurin-like phosphoesterase